MPGAVGRTEAGAEDKGEDLAFPQLAVLGRGWTQMSDKSRAGAAGGRGPLEEVQFEQRH